MARTEAEQLGVYLAYRSLLMSVGRPSLSRRLLLLSDPTCAVAASIAGGASLVAMPDFAPAKAALRAGCCNFLVSSLDEAVRILKNEIRRGAAISVGLLSSLADVERACVERGLQPDLLQWKEASLEFRGARVVRWHKALGRGESLVAWSVLGGGGSSASQPVSKIARQCIAGDDEERQRWLAQAPSVLGRQHPDGVPMHDDELGRFLVALDRAPDASASTVWTAGRQLWPRLRAESGS